MIDWRTELEGCVVVREQKANAMVFDLTTKKEWKCFHGHFPNWAVLPGVAMIDVTQTILKLYRFSGQQCDLSHIKQFRIKAPVGVDTKVRITADCSDDGKFEVKWLREDESGESYCDIVGELPPRTASPTI